MIVKAQVFQVMTGTRGLSSSGFTPRPNCYTTLGSVPLPHRKTTLHNHTVTAAALHGITGVLLGALFYLLITVFSKYK